VLQLRVQVEARADRGSFPGLLPLCKTGTSVHCQSLRGTRDRTASAAWQSCCIGEPQEARLGHMVVQLCGGLL
jgi:hypothetical protein